MPNHTQLQHGNDHTQPSIVIHLDTADATLINSSKNKFTLVLREPLQSNSYHEIMVFSLHNLVIPFAFYNVRENINNYMFIESLGVISQKNIAVGYYSFYDLNAGSTPNSLINPLWQTALNTALAPLSFTLDTATRRLKVDNPTPITQKLVWSDTTSRNTAYMLGFDTETSDNFSIPPTTTLSPPYVMDEKILIKQIKIKTSLPTARYYDNKGGGTNTFGTASIGNMNWGEVITTANQPYTDHSQACDIQSVSDIEIELTDEQDNPLSLNGRGWSVDIQVEFKPKLDFRRTGTAFTKRGTTGNTDIASLQRLATYNKINTNRYLGIARQGTRPVVMRGLPISD